MWRVLIRCDTHSCVCARGPRLTGGGLTHDAITVKSVMSIIVGARTLEHYLLLGRHLRDEKNSQLTLQHQPHRKVMSEGREYNREAMKKKVNRTPAINPLGLPGPGRAKMGF